MMETHSEKYVGKCDHHKITYTNYDPLAVTRRYNLMEPPSYGPLSYGSFVDQNVFDMTSLLTSSISLIF